MVFFRTLDWITPGPISFSCTLDCVVILFSECSIVIFGDFGVSLLHWVRGSKGVVKIPSYSLQINKFDICQTKGYFIFSMLKN